MNGTINMTDLSSELFDAEQREREELRRLLSYQEALREIFDVRGGQNVLKNIQAQLNGTYFLGQTIKVTILENECDGFLSTFLEELAKQLAKFTQVEVSLLVPESVQITDCHKRRLEGNGVTIVKAKRRPGFTDPFDWLYYPPEDLKTDIVIGIRPRLGTIAQHWKERYQCKNIYIICSNLWDEYKVLETSKNLYYRNELSIAANIPVAIGPKTTDYLSASLRPKGKQVFSLTPGIISEFSNVTHATSDGRNFRVLLVGGDNPDNFQEEGLTLAAKTMAELCDRSYHLIYVGAGKGTDQQQFANLFNQCGVSKRQLTIRSLPKTEDEWKKLFCEVDLAIMPSGYKEFGLEALLALSAGLPVLVHGESGFGEDLGDVTFGTSAIVDSDDAREWASRIKTMRNTDRKTRLEKAAKLRSNYDEKYSWEKQCGALVAMMFVMVSDGTTIFPSLKKLQCDADHVSDKSNVPADLSEIAAIKGFVVSDNQASGNCLFYALSEQLQSVKGVIVTHKELRRTLVKFLTENANLGDGTSLFNFVSGYPSWPEYLRSMAEDGTWGDHLVLVAAANLFRVPIRIISSLGREIIVHPENGCAVADTNPLVLGHVHELHYVSLQPRQVPLEILARGNLATEAYTRALEDGKGYSRRVPIMIIGQSRTGKTSLKRSLKGKLFNPDEKSTEGIETDPSYFRVSTELWKTNKNSEDTEPEPKFLFEQQAAQLIYESLKEEMAKEASWNPYNHGTKQSKPEPTFSFGHQAEESSRNPRKIRTKLSRIFEKERELSDEPRSNERLRQDLEVDEKFKADLGMAPSSQDYQDRLRGPNLPEDVAALVQGLLKNSKEVEDGDDIYSVLWDFGGQSVYYDTHPIFMTKKAIYLLTCELSCDPYQTVIAPTKRGLRGNIKDTCCSKTALDYLDFWMSSVYSLVSPQALPSDDLPQVMFVCTHADKPYRHDVSPEDLASGIYHFLKQRVYGKLLKGVFAVDNTKSGSADECKSVLKLREKVLSVLQKLPQVNEAIPLKWLKYERILSLLIKEGYKWIPIEKARIIASDECGINDDQQFSTLLNFLHDQRILIHFNESADLANIVILSPQWLIDMFKEVITVKSWENVEEMFADRWRKFEETGILDGQLLDHVWRNLIDDQQTCKSLIAIMDRFSLLCSWPSEGPTEQYLVPSMLMSPPTEDVLNHLACVRVPSLFVVFESFRVPPGLFSRLVLLFHQLCLEEWNTEISPELFNNFAMFHILPDLAVSVVLMLHSSSIEIIFHDANDACELNITRDIYSKLKCLLERICKNFFWLQHMRYKMCVCCPVCSQKGGAKCRAHDMRGCECLHFWSERELRERPCCRKPGIFSDRSITIRMFKHWFVCSEFIEGKSPLNQENFFPVSSKQQGVAEHDKTEKRHMSCNKVTAPENSATQTPEVMVSLLMKKDLHEKSKPLDNCRLPIDILVLTVEDCEFLSCLSCLNPSFCRNFHRDLGYVYLGDMGEYESKLKIAIMKCYGGSSSAGGSIVAVINAVRVLKPKAVFSVGWCCGLSADKVKLGDVVVLEKLITYSQCRVTENGVEERGVRVPLKPHLLKVILSADVGWKPPLKDPGALEVKVHRGTFLSGPEKVYDHNRCKALIERFPEAIAIEGEGEGVYAAAHDLDIEWIVIKGISHYADGSEPKTNSWRSFASLMAASLTAHILSDTIVFQDLPHYESASTQTLAENVSKQTQGVAKGIKRPADSVAE